jgi:hypothetical protein
MKEKDLIPVRNEYSSQLSKLLYNWQVKNKEALYSEDEGAGGFF